MAKPTWEKAPDWANWLAQDGGGDWWWYAIKPDFTRFNWDCGSLEDDMADFAEADQPNIKWQFTLEKRPKGD